MKGFDSRVSGPVGFTGFMGSRVDRGYRVLRVYWVYRVYWLGNSQNRGNLQSLLRTVSIRGNIPRFRVYRVYWRFMVLLGCHLKASEKPGAVADIEVILLGQLLLCNLQLLLSRFELLLENHALLLLLFRVRANSAAPPHPARIPKSQRSR